ncbi:Phosphate-repressible phosphate permease [Anopheles sinensis]|uniref:Phosphate-repressible phosphate permease n=1 Tax=Anopheles sinensis TaxID=74873 RepID=A0A084VSX4_ANOSI|nr:Phosphate-repressible phosphate permease [Anopheles sinensis]
MSPPAERSKGSENRLPERIGRKSERASQETPPPPFVHKREGIWNPPAQKYVAFSDYTGHKEFCARSSPV